MKTCGFKIQSQNLCNNPESVKRKFVNSKEWSQKWHENVTKKCCILENLKPKKVTSLNLCECNKNATTGLGFCQGLFEPAMPPKQFGLKGFQRRRFVWVLCEFPVRSRAQWENQDRLAENALSRSNSPALTFVNAPAWPLTNLKYRQSIGMYILWGIKH